MSSLWMAENPRVGNVHPNMYTSKVSPWDTEGAEESLLKGSTEERSDVKPENLTSRLSFS